MSRLRLLSTKPYGLLRILVLAVGVATVLQVLLPQRSYALRDIIFPVIGPTSFVNDFNAPRSGGRVHGATDIMAAKGQKLVAAVDGVITYVGYPQPEWGYSVYIRDSDGYTYRYLHINNDTPGTDDGAGGGMHAYAADMKAGNPIVKGQHIGWVGDSGNAESTAPHLHFEILKPDGSRSNPYQSLLEADHISRPRNYPQLPNELLPFGTGYTGGLNIAMGNFDGDPQSEFVVGTGVGRDPHVRVYDSNNTLLKHFLAYGDSFHGGVDVATGDVDGDGTDEIVTAAGVGGGSHIKVFELDGTQIGSFAAYKTDFKALVHVATGDVDGDGTDEIITGAGPGGGPSVKIFKLDGTQVGGFFSHDPDIRTGIDVAAGELITSGGGSPQEEIVAVALAGGGPTVKVFDGMTHAQVRSFVAYSSTFRGGMRVSVGNVKTFSSPQEEIMTIPASAGGPSIKVYNVSTDVDKVDDNRFLEDWWRGPYDVAAGNGSSLGAAGENRRGTIRRALR